MLKSSWNNVKQCWNGKLKIDYRVFFFGIFYTYWGSVHNWGTKNVCLTFQGLQRITLDFCLSHIIVVIVDCCMPINKMISC
jgi:hypothetical protein